MFILVPAYTGSPGQCCGAATAERRPCSNRFDIFSPPGTKQQTRSNGWDRQTDGRTDGRTPDRYINPGLQSAYYAGSVNDEQRTVYLSFSLLNV